VARNRFDWSALPSGLLRQLKDDFGLRGPDAVSALTKRFGTQPTERFVPESWPAIRDRWVAGDPAVRRSVVTAQSVRVAFQLFATNLSKITVFMAEVAAIATGTVRRPPRRRRTGPLEHQVPEVSAVAPAPDPDPPLTA
jgi:hypothetical protein